MGVGSVQGGRQLREVARRLREAGDVGLRKELTTSLKKVPDPIVRDLRSAVRSTAVKGFPFPNRKRRYNGPSVPKGLRAKVASAIGSKLTTSGNYPKLTIQADPSKLPEELKNIPVYLDNSNRKPWRHPVMGNRKVWVQEQGSPWWWKTIQPHLKEVRAAAVDAIERVADQIKRG